MHQSLKAALLAAAVFAGIHGSAQGQSPEVFRRASESVLKVEAGGNSASGFLWGDASHAVTSLHVVDGQQSITVHYVDSNGSIVGSSAAEVQRVLKESDLVLLRLLKPLARKPLAASPAVPIVRQSFTALGFPLNIAGHSGTEVKLRFGGNRLRSILPPKILRTLTDYPSADIEILNLEGNMVPGLSGAPIIDGEGRVVGIADGGLESGAIGISWGIPVAHLQLLAKSTVTTMPGAPGNRIRFAADLDVEVAPTRALGEVGLTKLRSRTYRQLAATADDFLGLAQLTAYFQAFDPNSFRYDVYQDLRSGATVVVPEGAQLSVENGFIVASVGDPRMSMKIRIKQAPGQAPGPWELDRLAQEFEWQLMELGPEIRADLDPAWTYLAPMQRPGMVIRRKAALSSKISAGQLQPYKYFFETLAITDKSLLAVAAVNNDSTPLTTHIETGCAQGINHERCAELRRSRKVWAQMVLGVQFSSYPPQLQ